MADYQATASPSFRDRSAFRGGLAGSSLRDEESGSEINYTRSFTAAPARKSTFMSENGGAPRSGKEGRTLSPHMIHRRTRTDVLPPPSNNRNGSQTRRISQTSLEDVELNASSSVSSQGDKVPDTYASEDVSQRHSHRQSKMAQYLRSSTRSQKGVGMPSSLKRATSANPFSFFAPKPREEQKPALPEPADDELLNLDIHAALFPPDSAELSGDDAFKNLQENAEQVIQQLQTAYKLRTFNLHESLGKKLEQEDQLEESDSRVQETKSQLDVMATRVAEQDRQMKELAEELKMEREKRQEEDEARRRSAGAMQEKGSENDTCRQQLDPSSQPHYSERSIRTTLSSDSGFESGDESVADSTLSKRNEELVSPTQSSSNTNPTTPTVLLSPESVSRSSGTEPQVSPMRKQHSPSRPSAYDRVMKGISSSNLGSSFAGIMSTSRCSNCRGISSSDAWSVLNVLKEENKSLKNRTGDLESAVEDCITLVGG